MINEKIIKKVIKKLKNVKNRKTLSKKIVLKKVMIEKFDV